MTACTLHNLLQGCLKDDKNEWFSDKYYLHDAVFKCLLFQNVGIVCFPLILHNCVGGLICLDEQQCMWMVIPCAITVTTTYYHDPH